jgi:hypothetical protein
MNSRSGVGSRFWFQGSIHLLLTLTAALVGDARTQTAAVGHITVRANVQVSRSHANWSHDEVILAADATNPTKMLACSIVLIPELAKRTTTIYRSENGGASWESSLTVEDVAESSDPACLFDADGMAYFSAMGGDEYMPGFIEFYRSRDAGKRWTDHSRLRTASQGYDRQFLVADDTEGKLHGRIYLSVSSFVRSLDDAGFDNVFWGMSLLHSDDDGVNWSTPAQRLASPGHVIWQPGNCDILRNSGVICVFAEREKVKTESERQTTELIRVTRSLDGGDSLDLPTTISSTEQSPELSFYLPHVVVDHYSELFRNRVYAIWSDTHRGAARIECSYSDDDGRSWSPPVLASDSESPQLDFLPQLAVSRRGILGVMWYRRRNGLDLGYAVRFSASLDGGNTFLPSVEVSENAQAVDKGEIWPIQAVVDGDFGDLFGDIASGRLRRTSNTVELSLLRYVKHLTGGETAGLIADETGYFHAVWVDDRTGVDQLWTAAIGVNGAPTKNGDPNSAGMEDVSSDVSLLTDTLVNQRNTIVSATVRLRNDSNHKLRYPLELRVVSIGSQVATLEILDSDNHQKGPGAIWNIPQSVDNAIDPGQTSQPVTLTFKLSKPQPWKDEGGLHLSLATVRFQVLAPRSSK